MLFALCLTPSLQDRIVRGSAIASPASVVSRPEITWQTSWQANRPALASGSVPGRKPLPAFTKSYAA